MKKCKIEVIKTTWDEELTKEFGVTCKCPVHKVGDAFMLIFQNLQDFVMKHGRLFTSMFSPFPI